MYRTCFADNELQTIRRRTRRSPLSRRRTFFNLLALHQQPPLRPGYRRRWVRSRRQPAPRGCESGYTGNHLRSRRAVGNGGFFFPTAKLGDIVRIGDSLGKIVDPLTNEEFEVISPISGEIVGMAVAQPVLSGYALFNLAWHNPD